MAASLPLVTHMMAQKRTDQTHKNMEMIAHRLGMFLRHHKRLPCPASIESYGTEDFGREDMRICHMPGLVPYKTLGISPSVIKDGAQHYITYHAHPAFSDTTLSFEFEEHENTENPFAPQFAPQQANFDHKNFWTLQPHDPIRIWDEHQHDIHESDTMRPIFALISHGMSGGDILLHHTRRPFTHDHPFKHINGDDHPLYIDAPPQEHYDDIVFWCDRFTFAQKYGGFTPPPWEG